jgi:hypothetical protein
MTQILDTWFYVRELQRLLLIYKPPQDCLVWQKYVGVLTTREKKNTYMCCIVLNEFLVFINQENTP